MRTHRLCFVASLFILPALWLSSQICGVPVFLAWELPASAQTPPPPPKAAPAEDTARYVAWMKKQGKPITDKAHEDVSLRTGDWGFFYHGDRPVGSWTPLQDRVGLDRSGHSVTEAEKSDWYAFLSSGGLDAAGALKRIAWLFNAGALDPASEPKGNPEKITVPTLIAKDGSITFQGWWEAFSDPPYSRRITITATPAGAKLDMGQ